MNAAGTHAPLSERYLLHLAGELYHLDLGGALLDQVEAHCLLILAAQQYLFDLAWER